MASLALVGFFGYSLLLFGGLGLVLSPCFSSQRGLGFLGGVLVSGIAIAAILCTSLYSWGLPTRYINFGLFAIATSGWALRVVSWRKSASNHLAEPGIRSAAIPILLVAAALLGPAILGGLQFSIFQGNHHDAFNYLEGSLTYQQLPYSALAQVDPLAIDEAGGFHFAQVSLGVRPSVMILYGTLSHLLPGHSVGDHYGFLAVFVFAAAIVFAGLVQTIAAGTRPWVAASCGGIVVLGFWGQYIMDINAWSQIGWLPLLAHATAFPLKMAGTGVGADASQPGSLREWMPWLVVLVGSVYLYPEGAVSSFVPLLALSICCLWSHPLKWRIALMAAAFSAALIPVYGSNLRALFQQGDQALSSVTWWEYYQAFLGGLDGFSNGLLGSLADGVAGILGVYFATPGPGTTGALAALWRGAYLVFGIGILGIAITAMRAGSATGRSLRLGLSLYFLFFLGEIVAFACLGQYWTAGKGLSYVAPLGMAVLLAAVLPSSVSKLRSATAWIVLAGLGMGSLEMAAMRLYGANQVSGIHFAAPYPAIQSANLKTSLNYADLGFLEQLSKNDYVVVVGDDPLITEFIRMELISHGIPYFQDAPVRRERYSNERIGQMRPLRAPTHLVGVSQAPTGPFAAVIQVVTLPKGQ